MSLRDKRQTNCRKSQRINTCLSVSQSLGLPSSQSLSLSLILTVCPCSTHASLLVCLSVGMSCWHWRWLLDWQKTQATVRVCKFIPDVNIPIGSHFTQVSCLFAQIAPTAADIAVHTLMYVRLAVPAQPVSLCGCVYECVCVYMCVCGVCNICPLLLSKVPDDDGNSRSCGASNFWLCRSNDEICEITWAGITWIMETLRIVYLLSKLVRVSALLRSTTMVAWGSITFLKQRKLNALMPYKSISVPDRWVVQLLSVILQSNTSYTQENVNFLEQRQQLIRYTHFCMYERLDL